MDEIPKVRLSAAIFRRGGEKKELFGQTHEEDVSDEAVLAGKIEALETVWSAPRIGQDLSAAVWKARARAAEVVLTRKSFSMSMGFNWRGKIYLNIEEAVYLLERGDLLLFIEDHNKQQQLLSIQEAYTLMLSEGCTMERYITYSMLMRIGYIVRRWPSIWNLDREQSPAEASHQGAWAPPGAAASIIRQLEQATNGQQEQQTQQNGSTRPAAVSPATANGSAQPSKKQRTTAGSTQTHSSKAGRSSSWWPAQHSSSHPWLGNLLPADIYQQLSKCIQVAAPAGSLLQRFPRMRPLGKLQQHSLSSQQQEEASRVYPDYDVYKPNSNFSRKKPDGVMWRLAMSSDMIPTLAMQRAADTYCIDGARLRMAIVQDGDVSFFGIEPASLTQFVS